MVLIKTDYNKISSRRRWEDASKQLYYAYQPIVNIHTGQTLGFEALLRGWREAGFGSINELFNLAYSETVLYSLDLHLRETAAADMFGRRDFSALKLFYNLDNRVLEMPDYDQGNTETIIDGYSIGRSNICFEISEKHEFANYQSTHSVLSEYKNRNYRIAIDDFGSGYSGLTLLYHSEPDYIKIDRFFIANINSDSRKKFFVSNVVNLAHMTGIAVIAEGIETEEEFYVCREIGCDYAQGYLIQRPQSDPSRMLLCYPGVRRLAGKQARRSGGDQNLIRREMTESVPLPLSATAEEVLEYFKKDGDTVLCPVVNGSGEPLGLLRESDLKKYVYSPYGISILQHKSSAEGLECLIKKVPVMEIYNPIEKIIELYSLNESIDGVIITETGRYKGILDSNAIIRILGEKKISTARDQNPLSGLPGNASINAYLSELGDSPAQDRLLAYFDLDNFKPFNDIYGFRQGDRIIRLFADILQESSPVKKDFIGHIGGDDFFVGFLSGSGDEELKKEIIRIIGRFGDDVRPFYKEEHLEQNCIYAKGRNGRRQKFPILTVSAALIWLGGGRRRISPDLLAENISKLKRRAKKSNKHIAEFRL